MKRLKESACVAIIAAVTMARAAECTLPTPPTSEFADTESAVNVPLYDWPELGRRVTLTLAANATPSNCVQIAFGQDTNGDENLEPEETMAVVGVDCGQPFARIEKSEQGLGIGDWGLGNEGSFCFALKQPVKMSERFNFAKVTTRGQDESAAQIVAEIKKPGVVLFVK